ncbi:MAG: hypothetical protein KGJ59_01340 [Bacteroidota bacterium]|nr:hypothetical protein [Bacteroidota bacterium]
MNHFEGPRPLLDRIQQSALVVGGLGACALVVGAIFSAQQFFQSYLFAYMFVLSFAVGSLGILVLHHMVSGRWGFAIQRLIEAAARTIPLMALLFIPILAGLSDVYPWMNQNGMPQGPLMGFKQTYLSVPFFVSRAVLYFVIWTVMAFTLSRWSHMQDQNAGAALTRKMRLLSAPGIIVYVLTMTFAGFDWVMSLEPQWYSSIFGALIIVSQVLSTLALCIIALRLLAAYKPFSGFLKETHFHHLGNLLLTFVVLWAYMQVSQLIIIWSGNLPEENLWYLHRTGTWDYLVVPLVIGHFFIPFFLLLSRRTKRAMARLALVAVFILAMRLADMFWLITPAFHPGEFHIHWLDVAVPISLGGLWLAAFVRNLKGYSLVPLHDPRFEPALERVENAVGAEG